MSVSIDALLEKAVSLKASDLHLRVGTQPIVRISGDLSPMPDEKRLTSEVIGDITKSIMDEAQYAKFRKETDLDLAYSIKGVARFRCNCFIQRGTIGIVFRIIPPNIMTLEELLLPVVLKKIALEPRGLVLVTGVTGSGKTTTLCSLIDYINENKSVNIITIEDPIEFLHNDKNSIIIQREIGNDALSFAKGLRSALRQDPDVILVGEMRDHETMQTALDAAETGHLVMSTLHTLDAVETVNRVISVFPPYQHSQIRAQLSSVLRAIISMRLVPREDEKGMVPAVEVLIATSTIKGCIDDPMKTKLIPNYIEEGFSQYGMQSFDQSLLGLYQDGYITYDDAISRATKPDDFVLKVKGIHSTKDLWGLAGNESDEQEKQKIERFSR
ncbi:MAG: PilT/PilU family type 4a pilus ATPase [Nitrospiraceae bacterium]|nr:MAG: PilT/PilU family type 4a pilus ATPase [Nitrospiraceae bacterium]